MNILGKWLIGRSADAARGETIGVIREREETLR